MKVGDIVELREFNGSLPKGAICLVKEPYNYMEPAFVFEVLIPHNFGKGSRNSNNITMVARDFEVVDNYDLDLLRNGSYDYELSSDGMELTISNNPKISVDSDFYKKRFKFIPINFKGSDAFVKDEKSIVCWDTLDTKLKKAKPRLITVSVDANARFKKQPVIKYCKAKVIGSTESIKLFGNNAIKREAVDKIFDIIDIDLQAEVKKSDKPEDTIYLAINGTNYRFAFNDIEIIYPNIKGYNAKRDKKIKIGDTVRCINDRHCLKLRRNDKITVSHLKSINNKKYIGFMDNDQVVFMNKKNFKIV